MPFPREEFLEKTRIPQLSHQYFNLFLPLNLYVLLMSQFVLSWMIYVTGVVLNQRISVATQSFNEIPLLDLIVLDNHSHF